MFKRFLFNIFLLSLISLSALGQITKSSAGRFNENAAYRILRSIGSSQATFSSTIGFGNYASTFQQLINEGLLESNLALGEINGYRFVLSATNATPQSPSLYRVTATPLQFPKSGRKSFYLDQDGLIHAADIGGAIATINEPEYIVCGNNEVTIIQNIRVIQSAQATFISSFGAGLYGNLFQLRAGNLIGTILESGQICGYNVLVQTVNATQTSASRFSIYATPQTYPNTGIRSFYSDQNGIIRAADRQGLPADVNDLPIE